MTTEANINSKLQAHFAPLHLEVDNESHMHNVAEGSESHFRVVIVSERFNGKALLARHRAVNQVLDSELKGGIHALSIHALTAEEWFAKGGKTSDSPPCLGGGK